METNYNSSVINDEMGPKKKKKTTHSDVDSCTSLSQKR